MIVKTKLQSVSCAECGVVFGLPEHMHESLTTTGGIFYCPSGHKLTFSEGTDVTARKDAERELALERQKHDQCKAALRESERKRKSAANRAAHGVCPCCGRTFKQLQRHMRAKHPEYVDTSG